MFICGGARLMGQGIRLIYVDLSFEIIITVCSAEIKFDWDERSRQIHRTPLNTCYP